MSQDVGELPRVDEVAMPFLDFADPKIAADPFGAARELAKENWIIRTPVGYALPRYEECDHAFRDRRFGVTEGLGLASQGITEGIAFEWANRTLLGLGGDEHRRIKMITQSAFTPRRAELLRGFAGDLIRRIYNPEMVAEGHGEVAVLNDGYSIRVMCALLGLSDDDWRQVAQWVEDINHVISVSAREDLPLIESAILALDEYLAEKIEILRRSPGESLGSALVEAEEQGDRLSLQELVTLFEVLLVAGGDTTSNMLSMGLYLFASRPEDWKTLAKDPTLVPSSVDELLRYRAPFFGPSRVVREDVGLNGVMFPKGTFLNLTMSVANFDPSVYPHGEQFDIARFAREELVPSHLSFGRGLHVCLGMHLAKVELQEAFTELPLLLPGLTFDNSVDRPVLWKSPFGIHGPAALHLKWQSARRAL
jgi:cytochrome P450